MNEYLKKTDRDALQNAEKFIGEDKVEYDGV